MSECKLVAGEREGGLDLASAVGKSAQEELGAIYSAAGPGEDPALTCSRGELAASLERTVMIKPA